MRSDFKLSSADLSQSSRSVLSDETHDAIMWRILNHEILPGARINIDALARDLGVSQTPVREALASLESENLVVKLPLRGYRATPLLTPEQVISLYQFRSLIEPWAAAQAAELHTAEDAIALRDEITQMADLDPNNFEEAHAKISAHDTRFHDLILQMAGNEYVHDGYTHTHFHLHMFRLFEARKTLPQEILEIPGLGGPLFANYYNPEQGFLTVYGHTAIAEAVLDRDAKKASELMLAHVNGSKDANIKVARLLSNYSV